MNNGECSNIGSLGYVCRCKNNCEGINCNICDSYNYLFATQNTISKTTKSTTTLILQQIIYQDSQTTPSISNSLQFCQNINDFTCNYFLITLKLKCNPNSYIGSIPLTSYCRKSCNVCSSSTLTTSTISTVNIFCYDLSASCEKWKNYCYIINNLNPHPCRKTCNLC
jgi:hypothetical protein